MEWPEQRLWHERYPHAHQSADSNATAAAVCPLCQRAWHTVGATRQMRDHCHACGAARGIICASCNSTLPVLEHERRSPYTNQTLASDGAWRKRAVRYLRRACACWERRRTGQERTPTRHAPTTRRRRAC